jgi:hypothetical protein
MAAAAITSISYQRHLMFIQVIIIDVENHKSEIEREREQENSQEVACLEWKRFERLTLDKFGRILI